MVIVITIISVIVVLMAFALISAILHIFKIQKELEAIARIEDEQNKDIRNAGLYLRDLSISINDIKEYLTVQQNVNQKNMTNLFRGPIGEA